MLAMPNAAGSRPLGDLLPLQPRPARLSPALPAVRPAGGGIPSPLRPLPAKAASLASAGAVNDYRPPLSGLVQQLKFHHRPELGPALARLLLQRLLQRDDLPPVDALVGVPLWHRRRWRRGYNQCDELCRPLARWRGCVWHREGLTRQRAGAVQHSLNARQRRQNLKNAFQLEFAVQGLHIALVDDVVTTGSTVAEISRLLLRNGAATVQVWCLCRTL
ncbi:protein GntX [Klebsiella pneumoniae]|uniref:Protein GntX n=1 Tax=Klebsiella pneumoniae TaxID=573 RepID=A0A378BIQ2_KLEPN|nr:protein GntX [Klebsiella pneumoniae]